MKYYLIAGEASGDLHASHLMQSLKAQDGEAEFRFFGGDLMAAVGGTMVKHYRELAYMGFVPVLLHLRTILRNMEMCKQDIAQWNPDVVILVDYPGFNLKIAKYVHGLRHQPSALSHRRKCTTISRRKSGRGRSIVSRTSSATWTSCSRYCRSRWSSSNGSTTIPSIM